MKKIVLVLMIFLSGCVYQTIDQNDIKNAVEVCEEREGVFKIRAYWHSMEQVTCKNGYSAKLIQIEPD